MFRSAAALFWTAGLLTLAGSKAANNYCDGVLSHGQQCGGELGTAQFNCTNGYPCSDTQWKWSTAGSGNELSCTCSSGSCLRISQACWKCVPKDSDFAAYLTFDNVSDISPSMCPSTTVNGTAVYNWECVLRASLMFYDAQRSGKLPPSVNLSWRGDAQLSDTTPSGTPLIGGFYDAGDLVKFAFPAAQAFATLAWGVIEFQEGYRKAGALGKALDTLVWATDFMMKSHIDEFRFVAQVGDAELDHALWRRPEDVQGKQQLYILNARISGGSDLLGGSAAALAAAFLALNASAPAHARACLGKAEQLYTLAAANEDFYHSNVPAAAAFYRSNSFLDDLTWAAAWLYRATGDGLYRQDAEKYYQRHIDEEGPEFDHNFGWDNVFAGATALLFKATGERRYGNAAQVQMERWLRGGGSVTYTPLGLAYISEWGSLRYAANAAFVAQVLARYRGSDLDAARLGCFAQHQLRYMLGEGGRSYVVGIGTDPPCRVHHRAASCSAPPFTCDCGHFESPKCNPHTIFGALVGGPGTADNFTDVRSNYKQNEVALDYNAGFSGALAAQAEGGLSWPQCLQGGYLNSAAGAGGARGVALLVALLVAAAMALLLDS